MKNLADHIFARQAKYMYFVIISVSLILGVWLYKWYLNYELSPINQSIDNMKIVSDSISRELDSYTYAANLAIASDGGNISSSTSLRRIFNAIGLKSKYMYGVGYFWNPKIYNYGEYIYENKKNQQIDIQSMDQIYKSHHTMYYDRPWFVEVMQTKSSKIYSPQISWSGESQALLTYAFPINLNNDVIGVGVYDISMKYLNQQIKELRGKTILHDNEMEIFYISMPYSTHKTNQFYSIDDYTSRVTDQDEVKDLNSIIYSKSFVSDHWKYSNGKMFRKVSLVDNSLILILEYNLQKIMLFTILWMLFTIVFLRFLLIWFKKIITRQLGIIVTPISEISYYTRILAQRSLNFPFALYQNIKIKEVHQLVDSLQKMSNNLQLLMAKELELEKSSAELKLASKLQSKMIPFDYEKQVNKNLSIAAKFVPAHILSGDLYDIVILSNSIYILIGDATGKNITAAFFSLFVLGRFRMLCQSQLSPSEILDDLNDYLCTTDAENMFISAICLRIDLRNQAVDFSNAGHEMPIIVKRDHSILDVENHDPDLVLGVIPNNNYNLYQLHDFCSLGHIVLITDGITEASSPETGLLWGIDEVKASTQQLVAQHFSSKVICEQLLIKCSQYERSNSPSDDRTIVVITF